MSTEYLDLTQFESDTIINYTSRYNSDMLKIDTNSKNTANNITSLSSDVEKLKKDIKNAEKDIATCDGNIESIRQDITIIDGNLDNIATRVDTLNSELDTEKGNITSLETDLNTIKQRVVIHDTSIGAIDPRTKRLFFYSVEKNVATSDTLFYNFDTVQLPAFIDANPNSGYKIHYKFVSYTRNGIGILAEFTQTISSAISSAVNNTSVTAYTMHSISGKTYVALYLYIVKAFNISIDNNNVLHANIDLESEGHNITFSSTGISDEKHSGHLAGKIIFSFEIFK